MPSTRNKKATVYLGIDGCRGGWVVVRCDTTPAFLPPVEIHSEIRALKRSIQNAGYALIDMPIGLVQADSTYRTCDILARELLQHRRSAIFFPPVREALAARSYAEACTINHRISGKKLSIQAWNIVPRIRQLDLFLRTYPELLVRIRESHPELCFMALNGGSPLPWNKRCHTGFALRMALLAERVPNAKAFLSQALEGLPGRQVSRHDVVDAMVLALHAFLGDQQGFRSLPDPPPTDTLGLPMAIYYARCDCPFANR